MGVGEGVWDEGEGVCCLSASYLGTMDNLTLLADQALYKAKAEGRNRCVMA